MYDFKLPSITWYGLHLLEKYFFLFIHIKENIFYWVRTLIDVKGFFFTGQLSFKFDNQEPLYKLSKHIINIVALVIDCFCQIFRVIICLWGQSCQYINSK